ncbi:MAG: PQQ-like beta-propeller repeat protein [Bacteroidales bacterium]|nr:PQQ-like beta-propeller repeat protein [Bacteroidales bacterium]MBN2748184.1 PQQ-like beta-propeller repeat protein [Bacteroidales bacterium]
MKRLATLIALVTLSSTSLFAQLAPAELWTTRLNGAVFATPAATNDTLIVGTESGFLYWINTSTGQVLHEVKLPSSIRSTAVIYNNKVYVESMQSLYCFSLSSAKEAFAIKSACTTCKDLTDPWDYFHSAPIAHNGAIYFVSSKGQISQVEAETGNLLKTISTQEKAEIRSGLTFSNETLYFGDNNGVVYGYNTTTEKFDFTIKTLTERPYPTFGFITGAPLVHSELLFVGSRHNTFKAYNARTQAEVWSQTDKTGSWWPTAPVVSGKNVIIGGSDNFMLSAFNLTSGAQAWSVTADYNIFCTPLVLPDAIVFGTGDSYLNRSGNGSVYAVNSSNGTLLAKYKPEGNVFSSPIEIGESIIICTTTGKVIALNKKALLSNTRADITITGDSTLTFLAKSSGIGELELMLTNSGSQPAELTYSYKLANGFPESAVKIAKDRDQTYGNGTHSIYLQVNANLLERGAYTNELLVKISMGNRDTVAVMPFRVTVESTEFVKSSAVTVNSIELNEYDYNVKLHLTVNEQSKLIGKLVSAANKSLTGILLQTNIGWGIYRIQKDIIPIDLKYIAEGKYILVIDINGAQQEYPFTARP